MKRTFFTSDLHLGHENVVSKMGRAFGSIREHDDCLIDGINATVGRKDRLYVLGDAFWQPTYKRPGQFRARIECRELHLIWGNHDRAAFGTCFSTSQDVLMLKLDGEENGRRIQAFLSHYPHAYWPASHHGSLHLYGHVHDKREATLDVLFPGRRSMDVGMDTAKRLLGAYRPFSEDEIKAILLARLGHDHVGFYRGDE